MIGLMVHSPLTIVTIISSNYLSTFHKALKTLMSLSTQSRIPLAYLGTVAVLALIFHKTDSAFAWMLYQLFSGGVMLGAIFMATDYVTSPVTKLGQYIYGIGCGVLTLLFRYFGLFPEGVTYAILLMNLCVWTIDRYTAGRIYGSTKGGASNA